MLPFLFRVGTFISGCSRAPVLATVVELQLEGLLRFSFVLFPLSQPFSRGLIVIPSTPAAPSLHCTRSPCRPLRWSDFFGFSFLLLFQLQCSFSPSVETQCKKPPISARISRVSQSHSKFPNCPAKFTLASHSPLPLEVIFSCHTAFNRQYISCGPS